jgi:hypothetical protein
LKSTTVNQCPSGDHDVTWTCRDHVLTTPGSIPLATFLIWMRREPPACADAHDADVRLGQRGRGAGFLLKAAPAFRIAGELRREDLDGNGATEASIAALVDLAHPSSADQGVDFVWPEASSRGKTHGNLRAMGVGEKRQGEL